MFARPHHVGLVLISVAGLTWPSLSSAQNADRPQPPNPVLPREIRENGPPAARPADDPGPAPAPNLFYVPGEYHPEREGLVWREGYWAEEQPGWAWIPARWVRQSDGWSFVEGSWVPDRGQPANRVVDDPAQQPDQNLGQRGGQADGQQFVQDDGVSYTIFQGVSSPFAVGYPVGLRYPFVPAGPIGGIPIGGVGFGGFGYPVGFGYGSPFGFGFGGFGGFGGIGGFGFGMGYRPFLW